LHHAHINAVSLAAVTAHHDWAILRVTFKPYPVCAFNQTPVTAGLVLREKLAGAPIRAVRVRMNPYETGYAGMDATGPFKSISGTLMSIPFCIAATLIYGIPDMRRMTTYDDPNLNDMISRITLISDPDVAPLCTIIEADTTDGRTMTQDQRMSTEDYAYDRPTVSKLLRRIGSEENVPQAAFDRLEVFVNRLPAVSIAEVLASFAMIEPSRKAA
jgi:2-methylcitrate dehydratase PrpD